MRVADRWYKRIIRDSKCSDRKNKLPITYPDQYVTTHDLIYMQQEQENKCYHCLVFMNWLERRSSKNGLTLDRRNTQLPHYKDNVCLACKSCNSARYTKEKQLLKRYFNLWYHKTFDIKMAENKRRCSYIV